MTRWADKTRCRSGLHELVEGSFRLEVAETVDGVQYLARRCLACQRARWRKYYEDRKARGTWNYGKKKKEPASVDGL